MTVRPDAGTIPAQRTPEAWLSLSRAIHDDALEALGRYGIQVDPALRLAYGEGLSPRYDAEARTIWVCIPDPHTLRGRVCWYFLQHVFGAADFDEVERALEAQLPFALSHELAHHLRERYHAPTDSNFLEEQIANALAIAFIGEHPEYRPRLDELRALAARIAERIGTQAGDETARYLRGFRLGLDDVLLAKGIISAGRLQEARSLALQIEVPLEQVLLQLGAVSTAQLEAARAERSGAEAYFNRRYMADLTEYWLFFSDWLVTYLGQGELPSLGASLRRYILTQDWEASRHDAVRLLLHQSLHHPDVAIAVAAPAVLAELEGAAAIPSLLAALDDARPTVQAALTAALDSLREAPLGALEERVAALLEAPSPAVRAAAVRTLGARARVAPALVRRLADPDPEVAEAAQDALIRLGPAAWPALVDVPASASDRGRVEALALALRQGVPSAASRLGELGSALLTRAERQARLEACLQAHLELVELARAVGEERRRLARLAVVALGHVGDPAALDKVERALDSPDMAHQAGGRQLAVQLLGPSGARAARLLAGPGPDQPTPLRRGLEDALATEPALIRAVAVEATGRVLPAGPAAVLLRSVAADPDPLVRAQVETVLRRLESPSGGAMLTTIEKLLFLRAIPTFQAVETEALRSLAELSAVQRFGPGDVVFVEGEWGDRLYIVTEGQITISAGGRDVVRLGPRHYFGEMALFDGEPRSATATALQETTLLSLDRDAFYRLGRRAPDVLVGVIHVLSKRLREANEAVGSKQ